LLLWIFIGLCAVAHITNHQCHHLHCFPSTALPLPLLPLPLLPLPLLPLPLLLLPLLLSIDRSIIHHSSPSLGIRNSLYFSFLYQAYELLTVHFNAQSNHHAHFNAQSFKKNFDLYVLSR